MIRIAFSGYIYEKNPEMTMDFSSENVHVKNNLVDIQFEWENFSNVVESKNLFILFFSANTMVTYIIPKRAFQTDEQLQAFRDLLAEKSISKLPTFNKTNRRYYLILILITMIIFSVCCMLLFSGVILNMFGFPH